VANNGYAQFQPAYKMAIKYSLAVSASSIDILSTFGGWDVNITGAGFVPRSSSGTDAWGSLGFSLAVQAYRWGSPTGDSCTVLESTATWLMCRMPVRSATILLLLLAVKILSCRGSVSKSPCSPVVAESQVIYTLVLTAGHIQPHDQAANREHE
jgi:hypothetical protein